MKNRVSFNHTPAPEDPEDGEYTEEEQPITERVTQLEQHITKLTSTMEVLSTMLAKDVNRPEVERNGTSWHSAIMRVRDVEDLAYDMEAQARTATGGLVVLGRQSHWGEEVILTHKWGWSSVARMKMDIVTLDGITTYAAPFPNLKPGDYWIIVGNALWPHKVRIHGGEVQWEDLR